MIRIDASHIVPGVCVPYPIRPRELKCSLFSSTVVGEQPQESPVEDIFPKDSEILDFGCQGAYPPKQEIVSVNFEATVGSGMEGVDTDPASVIA